MELKVLGSSSQGNCYLLENDQEALIIECGVNFNKVKQALNGNISKVAACLVTHEHGDHSKYINAVLDAAIDVYCSEGTHKAIDFKSKRIPLLLEKNTWSKMGGFSVLPFKTIHDAAEPLGFIIKHEETGNILFATDTKVIPAKFKGLHNIIIEANYDMNIIDRKAMDDVLPVFLRNRIIESHLSIQSCLYYLQGIDLKSVNNIVLIHLSDSNSNEMEFKAMVEQQTGKKVYVADTCLNICLNKTPF